MALDVAFGGQVGGPLFGSQHPDVLFGKAHLQQLFLNGIDVVYRVMQARHFGVVTDSHEKREPIARRG